MVSSTPGRPITRKERQAAARRFRARRAAERAAALAQAAAQAEETRAEGVAPAIQRKPVLAPSGAVLRHPRVEPDGLAFKVSNPVARLVRLGSSAITAEHAVAAARINRAWEEGGRGVGMGASLYGERTSGGSEAGALSDRVLAVLGRQTAARDECVAAQAWCGRLWPAIVAVVLNGTDVTAWGVAIGLDRKVALGRVGAALDRLVEFYEGRDRMRVERRENRDAQTLLTVEG